MKELRSDLKIPALQVAAVAKSFQEVVDFVIEVEGVKPDDFTMVSTFKNFRECLDVFPADLPGMPPV